jgi:SIR2-like domain/TIR domain
LQVFISYRRTDAPSAARQLAEALKLRFGSDHVFFDTRDIAAGAEWWKETIERLEAADVLLAIIGPHWAAAAEDRTRRTLLDRAEEDLVRKEIETALRGGAAVLPVLVDDAEMPAREALPRPFRALERIQAHELHHVSWDHDVETLAEALTHLPAKPKPSKPAAEAPAIQSSPSNRSDAERIACYIAEGSVVTVLGSAANAVDRDSPWQQGTGSLPDTAELARHLARRFGMGTEIEDLARVSQHVSLTEGRPDLHRMLRELLVKADGAPSSVHRFVASVPGRMRELGRECYQLVITTNYDTALERAFDEVHEPYDLVVFAATGEHKGRFLHVPWWDREGRGSRPITVPNEYVDLPIDEDGELERSVIVKLHGGAADLGRGEVWLRDNFVVTEDDYIGYLTPSPVESLVPLQILNKIRDSHFLFLGYRTREWSWRVFLRRVWGEQKLQARSWTVGPGLDAVERGAWGEFGVNVVDEPLERLLSALNSELGHLAEV